MSRGRKATGLGSGEPTQLAGLPRTISAAQTSTSVPEGDAVLLQRLTDWVATVLMLALIPILIFIMAGATLAAKPSSAVWVNELRANARVSLELGTPFSVGYATREREPWALAECRPNATTVYSATYADGTVWSEGLQRLSGWADTAGLHLGGIRLSPVDGRRCRLHRDPADLQPGPDPPIRPCDDRVHRGPLSSNRKGRPIGPALSRVST